MSELSSSREPKKPIFGFWGKEGQGSAAGRCQKGIFRGADLVLTKANDMELAATTWEMPERDFYIFQERGMDMDICFEGVGQVAATFKVNGGNAVQPGMAVTLTGSGAVGLGAAGAALCGVMLGSVRGGAAAVQIGGVVKTAFSGTAPTVGWQELVCDGEGGVKTPSNVTSTGTTPAQGLKWLVLAVDEDEGTAIIKL